MGKNKSADVALEDTKSLKESKEPEKKVADDGKKSDDKKKSMKEIDQKEEKPDKKKSKEIDQKEEIKSDKKKSIKEADLKEKEALQEESGLQDISRKSVSGKRDSVKKKDESEKKRDLESRSGDKTVEKSESAKEKHEKRKSTSAKSDKDEIKTEKYKVEGSRHGKESKDKESKDKESRDKESRDKESKNKESKSKERSQEKEVQPERSREKPPKSAASREKDVTPKSKDIKESEPAEEKARAKSAKKSANKKDNKSEEEAKAPKIKARPLSSKDNGKEDPNKEETSRIVSSNIGSPKAVIKRPDPSKNKSKSKKSFIKKPSMLPVPKRKKKKAARMESVLLTLNRLSAFLNENSDSLFDGPSIPRQTSFAGADVDDIASMDREDLEKSYKILKTVIADMERKIVRERERAKAMPHAMSNVPTSLEANMNLRYQYQKALDMEREQYVKLEKENQKLAGQMRVLEMKAFKFKKAQSIDEQTQHIQEVNVLRNKIKDLDAEKTKEALDHNRTLAQLEKVIKERDKLAEEILQMRRLQIHISHQLAERYTANTDGEVISDSEHKDEFRSGRAVSAKSGKSVKFAKDTAKPKISDHLVKGTAASEARIAASKEKAKVKADETATLAKLREKHRRKSTTKVPRQEESEGLESAAEDEAILDESGIEDESMMNAEVEEEEQFSELEHSSSYSRSSVSSRYNQSFNSSTVQAAEE